MSHEIRTHISAIIGLLELAATNKNQDDITESIQYRMVRIIIDGTYRRYFRYMAKIESGKLNSFLSG